MDISNLSTPYTDAFASASAQTASKLENKLNGNYSTASKDDLMDACKEFESYFLEQVFKEMQKTVNNGEDSTTSNKSMVSYFKDQMTQEIASESTEHQSLGLAQMLYEQMKRNYGIEDVADASSDTTSDTAAASTDEL